MDIEILHDGLTQRLTKNSDRKLSCLHILHLPMFLTEQVWERCEYSIDDIKTTLEYFSALLLWQCALVYDITPSNSAIKLGFSTPESMIYGSKAIVIRKIYKKLCSKFIKKDSVLDKTCIDHIPPIPVHRLSAHKWSALQQMVPKNNENTNLLCNLYYDSIFMWKDIQMVPLNYEQNYIYCVRIIPEEIFHTSNRIQNPSLSNRPLSIYVRNQKYYGIEETCLFTNVKIPKKNTYDYNKREC